MTERLSQAEVITALEKFSKDYDLNFGGYIDPAGLHYWTQTRFVTHITIDNDGSTELSRNRITFDGSPEEVMSKLSAIQEGMKFSKTLAKESDLESHQAQKAKTFGYANIYESQKHKEIASVEKPTVPVAEYLVHYDEYHKEWTFGKFCGHLSDGSLSYGWRSHLMKTLQYEITNFKEFDYYEITASQYADAERAGFDVSCMSQSTLLARSLISLTPRSGIDKKVETEYSKDPQRTIAPQLSMAL